MPSLSERLKAMAGMFTGQVRHDVESAQSVCAAVEAFQAAQQAFKDLPMGDPRYSKALVDFHAAKARLVEVNLT